MFRSYVDRLRHRADQRARIAALEAEAESLLGQVAALRAENADLRGRIVGLTHVIARLSPTAQAPDQGLPP